MRTITIGTVDKFIERLGARSVLLVTQSLERHRDERNEETGKLEERVKLRNREDSFVNRVWKKGVTVTPVSQEKFGYKNGPSIQGHDCVIVSGEITYQSFAIASRVRKWLPKTPIAIEFSEENYGESARKVIAINSERNGVEDLLGQLVYLTATPKEPRVIELNVKAAVTENKVIDDSASLLRSSRRKSKRFVVVPPETNFPETLTNTVRYAEGASRLVVVNAFERDLRARAACLAAHGYKCSVCGIDFERVYGEIGTGFIHVHHRKPLASIRAQYSVNPKTDLIPVCPNCHAMLHTQNPPLGIDELKSIVERVSSELRRASEKEPLPKT